MQDVKDEGSASGQTKEEVIETNERLRAVRIRLDESYDTAKKALVTLMAKYNDSKSVHNIFQRYNLLKLMIKVTFYSPSSFNEKCCIYQHFISHRYFRKLSHFNPRKLL